MNASVWSKLPFKAFVWGSLMVTLFLCLDLLKSNPRGTFAYMNYSNQQEIYQALKDADNGGMWRLAQTFASHHRKLEKHIENNKNKKGDVDLSSILDDKDALRTRVMEHLLDQSEQGNAQASHRLTEIAGLKSDTQDLAVTVKSYCGICGKACPS